MTTTIDPHEVENFSRLAALWWDPKGPFKPLHIFNPIRLDYIRHQVCAHFGRDGHAHLPLKGLRLLDIGCGGGLLAEPMCRLGADVTAIDASAKNIKTAQLHAEQGALQIDYRATPIETLDAEAGLFDVILNMEVIEHVADPGLFLRTAYGRLAPGGMMIVATLNRTLKAFTLAVVGAEYVLGWLPRGTHDWNKFLKPDELAGFLTDTDALWSPPQGVSFNPLSATWALSTDTAVNYMRIVTRPG